MNAIPRDSNRAPPLLPKHGSGARHGYGGLLCRRQWQRCMERQIAGSQLRLKPTVPLPLFPARRTAVRNLVKSIASRTVVSRFEEGTYYLPLSPTNQDYCNSPPKTPALPVARDLAELSRRDADYQRRMPSVKGGWDSPGNMSREASGRCSYRLTYRPFEYLFYNGQRRLRSRVQSAIGRRLLHGRRRCHSTVTKKVVDISRVQPGYLPADCG